MSTMARAAYEEGTVHVGRPGSAAVAPVACFAAHSTPEILVVCSDGFIARVEPPPPLIKRTKHRHEF